ncbi:OadG family protein [Draconibacterium sp. IB214405]|uniref:OadG family protein n=1 Tax=Draconibacterium sp. IB214405 TaxID=3097352 RepID=UPI002A0CA6F8|nr:OadG family protein [Draconibacterium sp. IB214405]MDX8339490.1 OadG family protein [Draconibacterium sp. IB214405]
MEPLSILLASSVQFGYTVAIVGFLIVFTALTCLVIVFTNAPKLINMKFNKEKLKKSKKKGEQEPAEDDYIVEGNVTAAISLALHMYFNELHDEESNIVTIKKVRKSYSPWSSKIYSVQNNWPR